MKKEVEQKGKGIRLADIAVLAGIVLVIFVVVMLTLWVNKPKTKTNGGGSDESSVIAEGEVDYSVLHAVDSQTLLSMLADGFTGFLYVGRPTCPHCVNFAPILTKVVEERGMEVYYYNTDAANSDPEKKEEALDAIGVNGVPSFKYFVGGQVAAVLNNTASEEALVEFFDAYQ